MRTTLGLKISRRLIAVVAVSAGDIVFHHQRHVPGRAKVLEGSTTRYLTDLLTQFAPVDVVYYAPTSVGSLAAQLVQVLESQAAARGIPVTRLNHADLFTGVSAVPLSTRRALHAQVQVLWPELTRDADGKTLRREMPLAEAAAAALVGHMWSQLPPP